MLNFILWADDEGELGAAGVFSADQLWPPERGEWHPIQGDIKDFTLAMVDGVLTEIRRSHPADVALTLARASRWADAKAYRDGRMCGTAPTPYGRAQIDDTSKIKISGVVQMALLSKQAGQPFSEPFTALDNSEPALGADQWIALGIAVGQFVSACQQAGSAIRSQIDAATTAEAIEAIDITAGYPA